MFKKGDRVKLSPSERRFMRDKAWDVNHVPGRGIEFESQAESYFVYKAVGNGLRYDAVVVGVSDNNEGTIRVRIDVGGVSDTAYYNAGDLRKVKRKRSGRK